VKSKSRGQLESWSRETKSVAILDFHQRFDFHRIDFRTLWRRLRILGMTFPPDPISFRSAHLLDLSIGLHGATRSKSENFGERRNCWSDCC
jgi:hypothetical protein